jgi:hypothetical protein
MAIRLNGQDVGSIQFTDNRPGKTIHIGPFLPTSATDGDVWFDSDTQNNAGKNLLQTLNLATIVGRTVNLSINADYKDAYIVIRGLVLSANANLKVTCNNDNVSYTDASGASATQIVEVPNIKSGITTNKFIFKFEDIQDNQGYQLGTVEGIYRNAANNVIPIFFAGAWLQIQSLASVQLTISAGGFTAGTVLVYGVN